VGAWLPHSPMLAFAIHPSYGGGINIPPQGGDIEIPPYGCLLASCAAPPSSWAMEDDPSSTILPFYSSLTAQVVLPLTKFCLHSANNFSPMLEGGTSTCTLSSHLHFPCFMYLTPKEIPTSRNFGFLVIFSRNHSPKIFLTFFSWTSTCSGLPSCNRVVLQHIHKELVVLHLQGE
jgi:hypothetical protein